MKTNPEKAKQLYYQCLKAYEKCRKGTGSVYNGMPNPGMFYDEYNVPAELLFEELRKSNERWNKERHGFSLRLLEWVYENKIWDLNSFSEMRKKPLRFFEYTVYLELFYRCEDSSRRPFSRPIIVDDARIEWCSKREYSAKYDDYKVAEQKRRDNNDSVYLTEVPDYKSARRFPKLSPLDEKYIHPIKITVKSTSSYAATMLALERFELLLNCLNVSQGIQKYSVRFFGGSDNNLGSKTVFVTTGHYIVCGNDELDTYTSDDCVVHVPKNKYDFSKNKHQLFRDILKSVECDNVARDRIENVLRDLSLAYNSTNAGIKTLSYWRCLEHATRCDGNNRREKDIIEIFKYQFKDEYWKQMGDLVLGARNRFVHNGLHSGKEEYVDQYINWAQRYAEQALFLLLRLYSNRRCWKTEDDLDLFFDNYAKGSRFFEIANVIRLARNKK